MKKLTNTSPVDQFYFEAHRLLMCQAGQFTLDDIFAEMDAKCDETVEFDFIKDVVKHELNDFLNKGTIGYIEENLYECTLIKQSTF